MHLLLPFYPSLSLPTSSYFSQHFLPLPCPLHVLLFSSSLPDSLIKRKVLVVSLFFRIASRGGSRRYAIGANVSPRIAWISKLQIHNLISSLNAITNLLSKHFYVIIGIPIANFSLFQVTAKLCMFFQAELKHVSRRN